MVPAALETPANEGVRRHFARTARGNRPAVERPEDVERPYDSLGTHPDLVAHLWDELTRLLPVDCRFVFLDRPVLIHPGSGIVFGFAGGTHAYALRLPEPERRKALDAGATLLHTYANRTTFDLAEIRPEWVFGRWLKEEPEWCLAAYELAGKGSGGR